MTPFSKGEGSMEDREENIGRCLRHRRIEHVGHAISRCPVMGDGTLGVLEYVNQARYDGSQILLVLPLVIRSSQLVDMLTSLSMPLGGKERSWLTASNRCIVSPAMSSSNVE